MDRHRTAERRSLALHRAIADRIRHDPSIVERARERLSSRTSAYREAWLEILGRTPHEIAAALERDDEEMRALRQSTPFTFVVDPRERWRIWRSVQ